MPNKNTFDIPPIANLISEEMTNMDGGGQIVLDPFAGVGSTAIACVETSRDCIACEIDKLYFDIAER